MNPAGLAATVDLVVSYGVKTLELQILVRAIASLSAFQAETFSRPQFQMLFPFAPFALCRG